MRHGILWHTRAEQAAGTGAVGDADLGTGVTLVSMGAEITTLQAANLLNVSPPDIGSLVDKGALPERMAGNQRRSLWLHRGCSQGQLAADLQRQPTGEACAPAVQTTSFRASGKQTVKFNYQQISIGDQLSASVIGQVVAGARLVSRRHRPRSRTFASLALKAPIAIWMPNNVCQLRSGRKSVRSRVYSVANRTEFRRTSKMRRKRKPG